MNLRPHARSGAGGGVGGSPGLGRAWTIWRMPEGCLEDCHYGGEEAGLGYNIGRSSDWGRGTAVKQIGRGRLGLGEWKLCWGRFKKNRAKLCWYWRVAWFQVGFHGSETGRRQEEVEGGNKKTIRKKIGRPTQLSLGQPPMCIIASLQAQSLIFFR